LIGTTPARAARRVAARAADFARRSNVRVLGVIENMSAYTCSCGERHELFGHGGGQELADELHVPLLVSVPLREAVSHGGDSGSPAAETDPEMRSLFDDLAQRLLTDIAPPVGAEGCSARLLKSVNDAVANAP
jgi:ATP-binding protein involved in chromosome partitioning